MMKTQTQVVVSNILLIQRIAGSTWVKRLFTVIEFAKKEKTVAKDSLKQLCKVEVMEH